MYYHQATKLSFIAMTAKASYSYLISVVPSKAINNAPADLLLAFTHRFTDRDSETRQMSLMVLLKGVRGAGRI